MKAEFLRGNTSQTIEVTPSANLLDQALSQGVEVDFACKRGDCAQCVATLVRGQLNSVEAARPFSRDNEIYLCNAAAQSDVVLRLPHAPETAHLRKLRSPCKIHELSKRSADVIELVLRLPPAAGFEFVPGQYIRLTNKAQVTRSYSLAEAPNPDGLLRIHVRRVEGGAFSGYLFSEARPGDLLHLQGPMGRFVLRTHGTVAQTIFLATGTGIAPIYAILSGLNQQQRSGCGAIRCYWGNRVNEDAYLHRELEQLAARSPLQYFTVTSRDGIARSHERYVQDLMAQHCSSLADAQVYASGNAAMIEGARKQCLELGLDESRFFSDPFTAS